MSRTDYGVWLDYGVQQGWVSNPFCSTHDPAPELSEWEEAEFENGGDPCIIVLKVRDEP
jgi:hypothetical protein